MFVSGFPVVGFFLGLVRGPRLRQSIPQSMLSKGGKQASTTGGHNSRGGGNGAAKGWRFWSVPRYHGIYVDLGRASCCGVNRASGGSGLLLIRQRNFNFWSPRSRFGAGDRFGFNKPNRAPRWLFWEGVNHFFLVPDDVPHTTPRGWPRRDFFRKSVQGGCFVAGSRGTHCFVTVSVRGRPGGAFQGDPTRLSHIGVVTAGLPSRRGGGKLIAVTGPSVGGAAFPGGGAYRLGGPGWVVVAALPGLVAGTGTAGRGRRRLGEAWIGERHVL